MPDTNGAPKRRAPRTAKKDSSVSTRPAWPDRFLQELAERGAILPTAQAVGVGRRTVYDEMARNPEFKQDVQDVLERCVEQVEETLYQRALQPDGTTDRIFYLKNRKPEVYADKLRPDQLAAVRAEVLRELRAQLEDDIAQLPDEARRIVVAAMRAREAKQLAGGTP